MSNQMIAHDFHGKTIRQRSSDGYFDATAMCKATGKRWFNYYQLDNTKAFIHALSNKTGIPALAENQGLIQSRTGGNDLDATGTWVHPYIAINLAQWCSPEFAVNATKAEHNVDVLGNMGLTYLTAEVQQQLTVSEIAKRLDLKTREVNPLLVAVGLQTAHRDHKNRVYYVLTRHLS